MQPNQNVMQPVQPASNGKEIIFKTEADKKGKGMVVGMIILALLAAGGIGFGVWAMLSKNQETTNLNSKIDELNIQLSERDNKINDLENTVKEYENGSNMNNEQGVSSEQSEAQAEVVEGVFYIKDGTGEIVAQDNSVEVTEIVACDSGTADSTAAGSSLKCSVKTANGQGSFVYDYESKTLTFTDATSTAEE